MVYILLADGFEEIEALTVCDILRRGGVPCALVSDGIVSGAHSIKVSPDISYNEIDLTNMDTLVLPGGMPGVDNLESDSRVQDILRFALENDILICAICAAPRILGNAGLLKDKKAACYPGFEKFLSGAKVCAENVVRDGNFITSRGMGTAMDFALEILTSLKDKNTADKISKGIVYGQK